jgi:uncharacterized protein (DUF2147 family)
LALTAALSPAAAEQSPFEGHWANPKRSMIDNVSRCGKGGTEHFIGTEILRVAPSHDGQFSGKAFDPESNMHVAATVRMVAPGVMDLKGCALFGLVCEEQRWTKVD